MGLMVIVIMTFGKSVTAGMKIRNLSSTQMQFTLTAIHDSRYIFYGVDFAAKNDASADTLGLTANKGNFNAFGYATTSNSYFEWGACLDYTLSIGKFNFKSIVFPFAWVTHKPYWGVMVAEETTINNPIAQIIATWAYAYVPDKDFEGLSGHYFFIGVSKEILGFKIQAGPNYNRHFFVPGNGPGGLVGITKTVGISEKVALDVYFKYWINHQRVNEDEKVVGTTLLVKL